MDVSGRVLQLRSLGKQRVIENNMGKRIKSAVVGLGRKALYKGVSNIDLEYRFGLRQRLTIGFQHAPNGRVDLILAGDDTGR